MSIAVSSLVWKLKLPSTEKLVLVRLADFADDDGSSIYPSVQRVADECGVSDRAVQITIRKLITAGILVMLNDGRGGRGRTTEYAIDLQRVRSLIQNPEPRSPIQNPEKGEKGEVHSPIEAEKGERRSQNPEPCSPDPSGTVIPLPAAAPRATIATVGMQVLRIMGVADDPRWFGSYGRVAQWLANGADPEMDIYPTIQRVMARRGDQGPPRGLDYFDRPVADALASRIRPMPEGNANDQHRGHHRPPQRSGNGFLHLRQQEPGSGIGDADDGDAGWGGPTLDLAPTRYGNA